VVRRLDRALIAGLAPRPRSRRLDFGDGSLASFPLTRTALPG
jgi:hypothetical protein